MAGQGTVQVQMASEPCALYKDVTLQVKEVQLATAEGKDTKTLKVDKAFTLQSQGATLPVAELLKTQNIEPKDYRLVSIVLDPAGGKNSVTLASGTVQPLFIPAHLENGISLQLEPPPRDTKQYQIRLVLDTSRSIQRTRIDGSEAKDSFTLRPRLRAVDASNTGTIKGSLSHGDGTPLKNTLVSAQVMEGGGEQVVRSARTGADGAYSLDLLPLARTYHLVNLPEFGDQAGFAAELFKEQELTSPSEVQAGDTKLQPITASGSVQGTIHRAVSSSDHDEVEVLQELPVAGGKATQWVVVHRLLPLRLNQGAQSSFDLALPVGRYQVRPVRVYSRKGQTSREVESFPKQDCDVKAGETCTLEFR